MYLKTVRSCRNTTYLFPSICLLFRGSISLQDFTMMRFNGPPHNTNATNIALITVSVIFQFHRGRVKPFGIRVCFPCHGGVTTVTQPEIQFAVIHLALIKLISVLRDFFCDLQYTPLEAEWIISDWMRLRVTNISRGPEISLLRLNIVVSNGTGGM